MASSCPVCGTSLRPENLPRHLATVHPREATEAQQQRAHRAAVHVALGRSNAPSAPIPWFPIVVIVCVVAGVAGTAIVVFRPAGPTPITEMCVNHGGIGSHTHAPLEIYINGVKETIPASIGVAASCMRPVHTHDDSGMIHIELPSAREATLGDFFTVWGKACSADQLMDYYRDASHVITMTVDDVPSTALSSHVLPHAH